MVADGDLRCQPVARRRIFPLPVAGRGRKAPRGLAAGVPRCAGQPFDRVSEVGWLDRLLTEDLESGLANARFLNWIAEDGESERGDGLRGHRASLLEQKASVEVRK